MVFWLERAEQMEIRGISALSTGQTVGLICSKVKQLLVMHEHIKDGAALGHFTEYSVA